MGTVLAADSRDNEPLFADALILGLRGALRGRGVDERLVLAFEIADTPLPTLEIVGDKIEPVMSRIEPDVTIIAESAATVARVIAGVEPLDAVTIRGDKAALRAVLGN